MIFLNPWACLNFYFILRVQIQSISNLYSQDNYSCYFPISILLYVCTEFLFFLWTRMSRKLISLYNFIFSMFAALFKLFLSVMLGNIHVEKLKIFFFLYFSVIVVFLYHQVLPQFFSFKRYQIFFAILFFFQAEQGL